jgi:hypothetical protein
MLDRIGLRRLLGTAILCSSLMLATGATPPPPSPGPAAIGQMPVVLVYPFDVETGADPRIGTAIAQILAQEMIAAGGINVPPVPQGIKRVDFLENARTARADFYISGYVTPVGDSAAVVEQVVSVDSGVILFSQTAEVSSVADVASQSLLARSQILAFVGRGTQTVETQPANTPAPTSSNGAQVPISGISSIVNSVFKHKGGTHTPAPSPVPKPSRGVIVAPVGASGAVAPADLANASHELYFALNGHFNTQMTSVTSNAAASADAICGSNRDNTIAAGTLQETTAHHGNAFTFNLSVYTCFGATLGSEVGKGSSIKSAVDAAVTAYATAHPENS